MGLIGAYVTFVVFAWRDHDEYQIPAEEVARIDRANIAERRDMVSAAGSLHMTAATMAHGGNDAPRRMASRRSISAPRRSGS